jgi:hypothetical protein
VLAVGDQHAMGSRMEGAQYRGGRYTFALNERLVIMGDYDKAGADGRRWSRVRCGNGIGSRSWERRSYIDFTLHCEVSIRKSGAGWK